VSSVETRPIPSTTFRQVMAHVPTSVAVVAAMTPDGPMGLTVGSFVSVSLSPPLVGFFPAHSSTSWPQVEAAASGFAVSVLGEDDEEICRRFARSGGDKFAGLAWRPSPRGAPVLETALAWFDCELVSRHDAGDHWCVLAHVHDLGAVNGGRPLVFCHGSYQSLQPTTSGA
jgi:3-hydroxy-9,10-secoandrosta-1,3,5(10)-triene-9,17-dione monooxygenase reductase component